jgi:high-affinity Fe2+/Pb2+ permease
MNFQLKWLGLLPAIILGITFIWTLIDDKATQKVLLEDLVVVAISVLVMSGILWALS